MKTRGSIVWGFAVVCAVFAAGCKKKEEPPPPPAGECVAGASEGCTCEGGLSGLRSCSAAETWSACVCGCTPDCSARVCGPDPICGASCGSCGAQELCNDSGQCEPNCTAGCVGRQCGVEPVCGTSCGTCGDSMVCDEVAGQCNATVLTFRGRAISDAAIEVLIGDDTFTGTADLDGNYLVPITSAQNPNAFVRIRAVQPNGEGLAVGLMSFAGVLADLSAAAGPNLIVDEEEHHGVVLDARSTIRWGVLYAANGGRMFADAAELQNAEEHANEPLSGNEWMTAVSWLQNKIDGIALPAAPAGNFANTLEIVENIHALQTLVAPYQFPERFLPTIFDNAREQILEASADRHPFPSTLEGTYFSELLQSRDGVAGSGGRRWEFTADGRGLYYVGYRSVEPLEPFSWTINDDGSIQVLYDNPFQTVGWYLTTEQIAARVSDERVKEQVELFLGAGNGTEVPFDTLGARLTRVETGSTMDWVVTQDSIRWRFTDALGRFGLIAGNELVLEWSETATFRNASSIEYLPFTFDEIVGDWVMELAAQTDAPAFNQPIPRLALMITAVRMHFESNGDVSIAVGRTGAPLSGRWVLTQSGRLEIVLGSYRHEYAKWSDRGGAERGVMYWLHQSVNPPQTSYARAAKVDPMLLISPELVGHDGSQYWQTTINTDISHKNADGVYPDNYVFGFTFDSPENAGRIYIDLYDDPPDRVVVVEQDWSWGVDQGQIFLERRRDKNAATRCTSAEPSCVPYRLRRWVPLAKDGPLLLVLEWEVWLNRYVEFMSNEYMWNETRQAWIHILSGRALDLEDVGYLSYPRVNGYYLTDLPPL